VFARLGSWCHRRRRRVVALWLIALVGLGALAGAVGTDFREEFNLPEGEAQTGLDILNDEFDGVGAGMNGNIVFRAEQGIDDPEVRDAMQALFAELDARDDVRVTSPYDDGGEMQVSPFGPQAGLVAFASVEVPDDMTWSASERLGHDIREAAPDIEGLEVYAGGEIFAEFDEPKSEIIGLSFAIVILIVSFGSVLAMGLPVGVALGGISVGTTLLLLSTQVFAVPDFAQFLGIMIGLGVGIDYALFIVTRYREGLHMGASSEEATVKALDTAGRAVAFAGVTVVVSFLGMLIIGMAFVSGLAIAAALVVATTVVASLTLLPALLGFAGERVEVTRWRGLIAAGFVSLALLGVGIEVDPFLIGLPLAIVVLIAGFAVAPLRREVPRRAPRPLERTYAYRWSRFIQHHPWAAAGVGAGFLIVLTLPVLGLRLGFSDEGNYQPGTDTREAYDLLAEGFGPGFNGPFVMAARLDGVDPAALGAVTEAVAADPGVMFVSPAIPNDPGSPTAALWRVIPQTSPQDAETTALVKRLRADVLPPVEARLGTEVNLTSFTAIAVDFSDYLAQRMPWFFAAVLILSFVLLMAVFRSILVPLKAVIMNLLSIGAAYGIVVAVFQWGWFSDLTGVQPAPIEPFMPMMLFAIVFGLSMDYEVFLLSRIKEEWVRTRDSHLSVANGLAVTAKVITAAAAIMIVVFGSFLFEPDRIFKLFGLGLAVAVLLDATVVRLLLVPATMELLGDRNWWLPRWLDRILPTIHVEGPAEQLEPAALDDDEPDPDLDPDPELQPA
jgi:putative drug exporter of the RND superfamily